LAQTPRQRIGQWGESAAAQYLEQHGYVILARNVRTAYGEIDLVARHEQGDLVFVEVKTRTSTGFGYPEEAVDSRKLTHLMSSAQAYMLDHSVKPNLLTKPGSIEQVEEHWRIDVIAVLGRPGDKDADVHFEHFENIAS
jgi:putative endonuclease